MWVKVQFVNREGDEVTRGGVVRREAVVQNLGNLGHHSG